MQLVDVQFLINGCIFHYWEYFKISKFVSPLMEKLRKLWLLRHFRWHPLTKTSNCSCAIYLMCQAFMLCISVTDLAFPSLNVHITLQSLGGETLKLRKNLVCVNQNQGHYSFWKISRCESLNFLKHLDSWNLYARITQKPFSAGGGGPWGEVFLDKRLEIKTSKNQTCQVVRFFFLLPNTVSISNYFPLQGESTGATNNISGNSAVFKFLY